MGEMLPLSAAGGGKYIIGSFSELNFIENTFYDNLV
jgi:hypothetical protein